MATLINAEVVPSVTSPSTGSTLQLMACAGVDRNFVLAPQYLNAVESKINQGFETPQKWIIGA